MNSSGLATGVAAGTATIAATLGSISGSTTLTVTSATGGQLNVGYQVVHFANGLKAAVWYPTQDPESTYFYACDMSGSVAYGGTPASSGTFPLVVFSHGYGGCGIQSLFFTEELARHGYVVAAPDHKDALLCSVDGSAPSGSDFASVMVNFLEFANPSAWTDQTEIDRRTDLEYLIGQMLQHPQFGPIIDATKIGGSGHSLGGYAVLGLGGAWISWKDVRIKAVLGFSPYVEPFLLHQGLSQVQVPVMYQGAQGDFNSPPLRGSSGAYAVSNPPKYFADLVGGSHLEWTNFVCLGTGTIQGCLQSKANAALIDAYGIAFLDQYLKGVSQPILTGNGSGLAAYQDQLQ